MSSRQATKPGAGSLQSDAPENQAAVMSAAGGGAQLQDAQAAAPIHPQPPAPRRRSGAKKADASSMLQSTKLVEGAVATAVGASGCSQPEPEATPAPSRGPAAATASGPVLDAAKPAAAAAKDPLAGFRDHT
jgi:hypothetical protein